MCGSALAEAEQGLVRALAEVGGDAGGTATSAAPGMPKVFAAMEALGAELMRPPCLITSLTSYKPPRHRESPADGNRHRWANWEAHLLRPLPTLSSTG